ncbi:MAG: S1C family serine protease [Patescibacteria group bacterium]|nr:S1C family serine protease [Patescibacteria group bacterium]
MRKAILKILGIFILGIFGGIFADQILWPYLVERPLFYEYRLEKNPVYVTEKEEITIQENVALQNAIEKVEKAVIGVKTETKEKILQGSGLILTSDGLVVTLADLVPQGGSFLFFIEGEPASFQVLKRDLKENLALIKLEKDSLSTVGFANIERLKLGERVFLVGTAFGVKDFRRTVNEGIVSNFNEDEIQTSILEVGTLAGSPLFNIEGELLGLSTVDYWGRVRAIPVTKVRTFAGF